MPVRPSAPKPAAAVLAPGMRVAVTGGAGFIGSHVVEELLRRGHRVHAVDDLSSGCMANLAAVTAHPRLAVTLASVADPRVAAAVCGAADAVLHLAGVVGVRRLADDPLGVMQANQRSAEHVFAAAAAARIGVLFTSSSEVYGRGRVPFDEDEPVQPGVPAGPRGSYACAKAFAEWLAFGHAARGGAPVVVARLFNTVGPRQTGDHGMVLPRFVQQAVAGLPLTVYGDGRQTRCFAHVAEVASALLDLASSPAAAGRIVNVGSDVEVPVRALAELVRARAGSLSPIEATPLAAVFPPGFEDVPRRVPSLARLRAAIGWTPSRSLPAIVDELLAIARVGASPPTALTAAD
ncbi:MAG: NAD-dependent epimerase/dehydratase family protein [Planctomycetota bacterium]